MIYKPAQRVINNDSEDLQVIRGTLVLAERALRYSVNLDGFVHINRDSPCRGGFAVVWSGVLRLIDALAAGREIARNRFFGDGGTVKVILRPTHDTSL